MKKQAEQLRMLIEGWDGYPRDMSKEDIVKELIDSRRFGVGSKLVDSKMAGNEFWSVWYLAPEKKNVIILDLFEKHGKEWMVKGLDERAGPYYYKCPKEFLKLAPVENQEWRDKVLGK